MANSDLTFMRTLSPSKFKTEKDISTIQIVKNPNTGKLFFTSKDDSSISGPVSGSWKEDPAFSEVRGDEGEVFWMLHKRGSGDDNVVDTL